MVLRGNFFAAAAAAVLSGVVSCTGCGEDPAGDGPLGGAPEPRNYDVEQYALAGAFDWDRGRLVATVGITLTTLEPDVTRVTLDTAVAEVKSIRAEDGADLPFTIDGAAGELTVDVAGLAAGEAGARLAFSIAYEAAAGESLRAVAARAGDPVAVRALYTFSEPLGASRWMPCNNRPDDRALFSVEMVMDAAEQMIANGDPTLDEPDGASGRRMAYTTEYPLPTYLMAFAVGDFEVESANHGELPIAVWHRPGVPGDWDGTLAELDRQIAVFESLLGPYPFEKYALVLLPDFSGGMEHASITFQTELTGGEPSLAGDVSLTAHELGHQWYGDLVTVATWDDVWIKEGMATLLSAEAGRAHEDLGATGVLFGDAWFVRAGEAIRDTSLAPEDKYTTGPYDRAAWLFTQIRGEIGEEAFWGALRGLLEEHRFGALGTDDVLAAFAPHLGPDLAARARAAVDARDLPRLELAPSASGGVFVTVQDPEQILVAPMEIEWHRADGATEREALVPGQPLELVQSAPGDFLVIDPRDVHPDWALFLADEASAESYGLLVTMQRPGYAAAVARFSELAGVHQRAALDVVGLPPIAPDAFAGFVASLDAESAKALSVQAACSAAPLETDPAVLDAWVQALTTELTGEPHWLGLAYTSYGACSEIVSPVALFPDEFADLASGLPAATLPEPRVWFLSRFELPLADALGAWGNTTASGHSLRTRALAARQIRANARRVDPAVPADWEAWRARVLELIQNTEASEVLRQVIPTAPWLAGPTAADNADFLAALADVLRSPATRLAHAAAVCAAVQLVAGDAEAWASFVAGLEGAPLSLRAQALVVDPVLCL